MDDLISRQAALDAIRFAELGCEYEAVEALPSAEKHGEWVLGDDGAFHCSCCEKIPVNKVFFYGMMFYDAKVAMVSLLKFCPFCGAKMGEKDG